MNLQSIALFLAQWALIEVSKKFPGVGKWISANAPAITAAVVTVSTFLQALLAPTQAQAQAADTLATADSLAVVAQVVPVYVGHGLSGWLSNFLGTVMADNVVRKIVWHYVFGKILKLPFAVAKP